MLTGISENVKLALERRHDESVLLLSMNDSSGINEEWSVNRTADRRFQVLSEEEDPKTVNSYQYSKHVHYIYPCIITYIICKNWGYSHRLPLNCGNFLIRSSLMFLSVVFTLNPIFAEAIFFSSLFDDVTYSVEYIRNVFWTGLFFLLLPSSSSEVEGRLQAPPFPLLPIVTEKMQRSTSLITKQRPFQWYNMLIFHS